MEQIAQVYARSLFEVAQEHDKLDLVREQLGQFADALTENREMRLFLFSPYFSTQEKREGLRARDRGRRPGDLELPRRAARAPPPAGHQPPAARCTTGSGTRPTTCCR